MTQPPPKKATPHIDPQSGDGDVTFLDDETRARAIECIQKRSKIVISSTKLQSKGLSSEVAWEQKVD